MNQPTIEIILTGDLVLGLPDPDPLFRHSLETFHRADLVIGHVEIPHTTRPEKVYGLSAPADAVNPEYLGALGRAGIDVATLAGNHIFDSGPTGIEDTLAALRAQGIATTGAGMNMDDARKPAIIEKAGVRVGVLSYNCVGPKLSWASPTKPGAAYLDIITQYGLDYESPGGPPSTTYSFAEPVTLEAMQSDVEMLRGQVDVVVVAFHKGIGHVPATVAMYERQVSRAAIDAGADIVVGHHAHVLRGVETYKGKPIFHGLSNYVTVTRQLSVNALENTNPVRMAWAKRRREMFGFEPDPDYPTYPFHPEAKNSMLAVCVAGPGGVQSAGFVPVWIEPDGSPRPLGRDAKGEEVASHIQGLNDKAGLEADLAWRDDRVIFLDHANTNERSSP
jgi:poly-gamma-glutamate capsule biosynthesis protein CapA/YwtB (metallophosphatase superfamily)